MKEIPHALVRACAVLGCSALSFAQEPTRADPSSAGPSAVIQALAAYDGRAEGLEQLAEERSTALAGRTLRACLDSLAELQRPDGSWSATSATDVGPLETTAWAVLALTSDGSSLASGSRRPALERGVAWLRELQDDAGDFVAPGTEGTKDVRVHALATLALAEASRDSETGPAVDALRAAVGFLERERSPAGGWGKEPRADLGDLRTTAWAASALVAAVAAGVPVAPETFDAAARSLTWSLDAAGSEPLDDGGLLPRERTLASFMVCALSGTRTPRRLSAGEYSYKELPPRWADASIRDDLYLTTFAVSQRMLALRSDRIAGTYGELAKRMRGNRAREDALDCAVTAVVLSAPFRHPVLPRGAEDPGDSSPVGASEEPVGGGAMGGPFGSRGGGRSALRFRGAGQPVALAIEGCLDRLAELQRDGGGWAGPDDVEATAWAMLAIAGDGSTLHEGDYVGPLRKATRFLVGRQEDRGGFTDGAGARVGGRAQALATYALAECGGLSQAPKVNDAAQRAVRALEALAKSDGTWAAGDTAGVPDLLTTTRALWAGTTARTFGLEVEETLWTRTGERLAALSSGSPSPFDGAPPAMLTTAALWGRILGSGERAGLQELGDAVLDGLPSWSATESLEPLVWRIYGLYQLGGFHWKTGEKVLHPAPASIQESLSGLDATTAAQSAILLEVYYRYTRLIR